MLSFDTSISKISDDSCADELLDSPQQKILIKPSVSSEKDGLLSSMKRALNEKVFGHSNSSHNNSNQDNSNSPTFMESTLTSAEISKVMMERIHSTDTIDLNRYMSNESMISRNPSADIFAPKHNGDIIDSLYCPSTDHGDRLRHHDVNGESLWPLHRVNESYDASDTSSPITARSTMSIMRQSSRDSNHDEGEGGGSRFGIRRQSSRESESSDRDAFDLNHHVAIDVGGLGSRYLSPISRSESRDFTDISSIASLEVGGGNSSNVHTDYIDLPPVMEDDFGDI